MMSTKGKRPMRALTAGDKIEAIQRVNDGESKASVARDIGVPESTLRGWCKNEDKLRYMSTRHSTPDTDKSCDGMMDSISEKRMKYDLSPSSMALAHSGSAALTPPLESGTDLSYKSSHSMETGLDLSSAEKMTVNENVAPHCYDRKPLDGQISPVDLGKPKSEHNTFGQDSFNSGLLPSDYKIKPDSGANVSMSAVSPLSAFNHLTGMSGLGQIGQSHLGLSFNDIATNLSLIAQLNPNLTALTNSINNTSKNLRSIRSPKPNITHSNGTSALNLSEKSYKSSHKTHSDNYSDRSRTKSSHSSNKEIPVDDAVWYWLKTQQAMLDLTSHTTQLASSTQNLSNHRSSKDTTRNNSPKPSNSTPSLASQLDSLNQNSWFWQYYKQYGTSISQSEEKIKNSIQLSKENENILYSQLTKSKSQEPLQVQVDLPLKNNISAENMPVKEIQTVEKDKSDVHKNHSKVRTVLDNLLFNNNNLSTAECEKVNDEIEKDSNTENEFDGEVSEALEHGEKFLKWLEACEDPSVTRMQVFQLKGLLTNIRARAERKPQAVADRVSRRK